MADFFDRIMILKSTSIFSEVSTDDLRVVGEEMEEEAYFPGEHVFEVNDPSDRMYIVLTGKIGNPGPLAAETGADRLLYGHEHE